MTPLASASSSPSRAWIAGAVLGPITLLSLVLLAGFFILRRRRKQRAAKDTPPSTEKAQLEDTEVPRKELHDVHIQEADAETARKELSGRGLQELGPPMEPAELDANSTNRSSTNKGTESTLVSDSERPGPA